MYKYTQSSVSYFQGAKLIILETMQLKEEAALDQLPISHLSPPQCLASTH